MSKEQVQKKTSIGGQALIEGIMMRGPEKTSMAVRHTSGEIKTEEWDTGTGKGLGIWKVPFIRGVRNFISSMSIGYKTLMKSAEMSGIEDEFEEENKKETSVDNSVLDVEETIDISDEDQKTEPVEWDSHDEEDLKKLDGATENDFKTFKNEAVVTKEEPQNLEKQEIAADKVSLETEIKEENEISGSHIIETSQDENAEINEVSGAEEDKQKGFFDEYGTKIAMIVGSVLGVVLSVVLFMLLPSLIFDLLTKAFPSLETRFFRSVIEGVIRILLFLAYIILVSFMEDIKRVFMYHGAEHKAIFCYEKGLELTVENVRKQSRFHPRCGTSFMAFMLVIGIIVSMFIPVTQPVLRSLIKIATIPIVVGLGYELIKLAGRSDNIIVKIISQPGIWIQHITTKEPTDDMIEVAITALETVVPEESTKDIL